MSQVYVKLSYKSEKVQYIRSPVPSCDCVNSFGYCRTNPTLMGRLKASTKYVRYERTVC